MAAPKGNKFWQARKEFGRKKIYQTPQSLWEAFIEYAEWVEANPLQAAELVKYQGKYKTAKLPKMRAMTETEFVEHSLMGLASWDNYCSGKDSYKDFLGVTTRIKTAIKNQKLQGAAADMLNANIIARDLGLADKQDIKKTTQHSLSSDLQEVLDGIYGKKTGE